MRLLQRLTEAKGVSGYEHEVRHLMQEEFKLLDVPVVTKGFFYPFCETPIFVLFYSLTVTMHSW